MPEIAERGKRAAGCIKSHKQSPQEFWGQTTPSLLSISIKTKTKESATLAPETQAFSMLVTGHSTPGMHTCSYMIEHETSQHHEHTFQLSNMTGKRNRIQRTVCLCSKRKSLSRCSSEWFLVASGKHDAPKKLLTNRLGEWEIARLVNAFLICS